MTKIVFNGREFDGVESMPPDVRKEYENALSALGAEERDKVAASMGHGAHVKLNVTVHTKFRVNGKDYDSVEAMPADVRAAYERALQQRPGMQDTATSIPKPALTPSGMPVVPPAIDAADSRRASLVRIAVWVVIGLVVLVWLLARR